MQRVGLLEQFLNKRRDGLDTSTRPRRRGSRKAASFSH